MSLMEPVRKNGDLYIDPIFDQQTYVWTAEKVAGELGWNVSFLHGHCSISVVGIISYVRGVRFWQSIR